MGACWVWMAFLDSTLSCEEVFFAELEKQSWHPELFWAEPHPHSLVHQAFLDRDLWPESRP